MLANPFVPATKEKSRARLAFIGAPGSGKTWMALEAATRLAELRGGKIAVIDTEGRSARKYADEFEFDVFDMSGTYAPKSYIAAMTAAIEHEYAVLVIDSFSHAWNGAGGVLEIVDRAGAAIKDNKFAGWAQGRPAHNNLVNALITADIDVIVTMRAKVEWSLETNKNGKSVPVQVGTAAVQSDGIEHEFDLALNVDMEHCLTVRKTRVRKFPTGEEIPDTQTLIDGLFAWLTTGTKQDTQPVMVGKFLQTDAGKQRLADLLEELDIRKKEDHTPYFKALGIEKAYSEYPGTFKAMEEVIRETHTALNAPPEQVEDDTAATEPTIPVDPEDDTSTDAIHWSKTDALDGLLTDVIKNGFLKTGATLEDMRNLADQEDWLYIKDPETAMLNIAAAFNLKNSQKPADVPTADEVRDTIEHKPGRIDTTDKPIVNGAAKPPMNGPRKSVLTTVAEEQTEGAPNNDDIPTTATNPNYRKSGSSFARGLDAYQTQQAQRDIEEANAEIDADMQRSMERD